MTTEPPPSHDLFWDVLATLNRMGAPYMIVGAVAAIVYGVQRMTYDIDIVVKLNEQHVLALAAAFPAPRYYADPEQMRESIRHGTLFNIIDTSFGEKADFVPLRNDPQQRRAFARRTLQSVELPTGERLQVWCAQPEDVIIGKLAAWTEGGSRKHESDILQMLIYAGLHTPAVSLPPAEIAREAARLGEETYRLWTMLEQKAARELASRR